MYLQILFAWLQPRLLEPTNSAQLTAASESAQPQGPFWGWSKEREAHIGEVVPTTQYTQSSHGPSAISISYQPGSVPFVFDGTPTT